MKKLSQREERKQVFTPNVVKLSPVFRDKLATT